MSAFGGMTPSRPAWKSSTASTSCCRVFMTNGPYCATGSRIGCPPTLEDIEAQIQDIAGVRIVCPFASDVYWISDMLTGQPDVTVLEVEDYIARPKANGYRSLHLIVTVPVYLSDRTEHVPVELQIRTIAMDFWASVEHAIYYKYDGVVPTTLLDELHHAAITAASLDETMSQLRAEVRDLES